MATTKTKPITLFVPFTKIERRAEDDALIVEGYCFVNPTVKGDRYSIKRAAMEAATPEYLKFPAVREMHQPIAAGTGLEVVWDERGCLLRSECVDEGTKRKIERKVLRGYSVGVNPIDINRADEVESLAWVETSYVDRPKDPDAVFLYRAEGFDPDAEIEVNLLDDPSASPHAEEVAPVVAAPTNAATVETPPTDAIATSSSSEVTATAEASPAAPDPSGAAGAFSPPEERAAVGDASRLWARIAGEVAEEATAEERRAFLAETLQGFGVAEGIAADMAARVDVMRALTSDSVPVRENLEGARRPRGFQAIHAERQPEMLAGGIMDAHTSLAHSLYSILDSDADDKPALIKSSVSEYADHVNGLCKKRMQRAEDTAALTEELAALARADKPEGDYGADASYADPGYQSDKKPRYPLDTKEHAKAAWGYINQAGNASKYSSGDLAKVKGKIKAAAEKFGVEISDESERAAEARIERYSLWRMRNGDLAIRDFETDLLEPERFRERGEADRRLAELQRAAAVEAPPAAPETVSRSSDREETTDMARLETVTAELSRVQAAYEGSQTRLAAAEAEVRRLADLPAREKPVARFTTQGIVREFLANQERREGEEDVAAIRRLYEQAVEAAATETDAGAKRAAMNRVLIYKEGLRELGVTV